MPTGCRMERAPRFCGARFCHPLSENIGYAKLNEGIRIFFQRVEQKMIARLFSYALNGLDGFQIDVEVDISRGALPAYDTVGLPDAAVKESKERVRAAIKNSGFSFPLAHITVNLAPADARKEGSAYDLAIALGILSASQQVHSEVLKDALILGELSLNGEIRGVRGVLPMLIAARQQGVRAAILPQANVNEAICLPGIDIYAADSLRALCDALNAGTLHPAPHRPWTPDDSTAAVGIDLSAVKGQTVAKRALEIAAAGGHNLLMVGAPGSGKTMLARCLPTILPPLCMEEALEVTKIHSIAGLLGPTDGLVRTRPFRAPHHSASAAAMLGGGRYAKPGEISLAHLGVLFLDEFPEFPSNVLEAMRQPLEDGVVNVARVHASVTYPARVMLVAAMNPCPCGYYGSTERVCRCTQTQIARYLSRISGPMLDRIDVQIEMEPLPVTALTRQEETTETSQTVRARVIQARQIQQARYQGQDGVYFNAQLNAKDLKKAANMTPQAVSMLEEAMRRLHLSARAYARIIKVSRTIADLAQSECVEKLHVAEAVQYRMLDRKYWRGGR